jgi:uncharacterized integral membrane protein
MRLLSFIFRILLFFLVLVFALANTHPVVLTLVPGVVGLSFEAPMVLWLLAVFCLGVFACFLFLLPTLMASWRKGSRGN